MEPFRELVPENLWKGMEKKLGREQTLRLLWPAVVGPQLAALTRLEQLRGSTVVVSVADREWRGPLESVQRMILDAVNRFRAPSPASGIEIVVKARPAAAPPVRLGVRPEGRRAISQQEVSAGGIEDARLREAFVRSAQKYFARQQE